MSNLTPYTTDDGSLSFRNIKVDEMYHTKSGAREEAFEKHARPVKPWEKQNPVIYDICFGLGYNAAAAIDVIRENGNNSLISIYIFENDTEILEKILEINAEFKSFSIIKNFVQLFLEKHDSEKITEYEKFYEKENIKMKIYLDDARTAISKPDKNADYVFFDPFSPTHHPEMWELTFIKDIYNKMSKNGKLTTYSYARKVRETFQNAGFEVTAGPIIGRISPSTIAIKK